MGLSRLNPNFFFITCFVLRFTKDKPTPAFIQKHHFLFVAKELDLFFKSKDHRYYPDHKAASLSSQWLNCYPHLPMRGHRLRISSVFFSPFCHKPKNIHRSRLHHTTSSCFVPSQKPWSCHLPKADSYKRTQECCVLPWHRKSNPMSDFFFPLLVRPALVLPEQACVPTCCLLILHKDARRSHWTGGIRLKHSQPQQQCVNTCSTDWLCDTDAGVYT